MHEGSCGYEVLWLPVAPSSAHKLVPGTAPVARTVHAFVEGQGVRRAYAEERVVPLDVAGPGQRFGH